MIEILGDRYNDEDMIVDTVEKCDGYRFTDGRGIEVKVYKGYIYNGGLVVDCFVHPESDTIFFVVLCDGVYFCVTPDTSKYTIIDGELKLE